MHIKADEGNDSASLIMIFLVFVLFYLLFIILLTCTYYIITIRYVLMKELVSLNQVRSDEVIIVSWQLIKYFEVLQKYIMTI